MNKLESIENYNSKISKILISEQEIHEAVLKMGKQIDEWYDGTPILLVSLLNGAFIFMADLCRAISVPCEIAFMRVKSYKGTTSTGTIDTILDLDQDISGYNVIIVEDIIDTGRTLNEVIKDLRSRNPISLKVVTLLDKPERRVVDFKPDVAMFTIPDLFVIGYGLDCNEHYRNLPYIAEYSDK